jgi:hypothetical protein
MRESYEEALRYRGIGLCPVPSVPRGKRIDSDLVAKGGGKLPLAGWSMLRFQYRPAPEEVLRQWFLATDANLSLTCSGSHVCIDFDDKASFELRTKVFPGYTDFPICVIPRGYHVHFKWKGLSSLDFRGNLEFLVNGSEAAAGSIVVRGGIVVMPPSINREGAEYHWLNKRSIIDLGLPEVDRLGDLNIRAVKPRPAWKSWHCRCFSQPGLAARQIYLIGIKMAGKAPLLGAPQDAG